MHASGNTCGILIKSTDDYTNNYRADQSSTGLYNARTADHGEIV